MKKTASVVVAFLGGIVVAILLIAEFDSPSNARNETSVASNGSANKLGPRSAKADEPNTDPTPLGESQAPQSAREERILVEDAVRTSGSTPREPIARELVQGWRTAHETEGLLDVDGTPTISGIECFDKGCILSLTYPTTDAYYDFEQLQVEENGLVEIWPGSKFSSGLDESVNPPESSWVLYFDDAEAWDVAVEDASAL